MLTARLEHVSDSLGCGCGRHPGRDGVVDRPDADRLRLVPARGGHSGGAAAVYAKHFPLVEVDSAYYALPSEQTAALWAERTPARFTFNIKAFSLSTQHPTRVARRCTSTRPSPAWVTSE